MQILFMGVPLAGHLYPMAALMDAADAAGHEVVVVTGEGGAALLPQHRVLEAGPSVAASLAETDRRTGETGANPGVGAVELFGGVRTDLGADAVLDAVEGLAPDLVVGETTDQLAPLVAAAVRAPYVEFLPSGPLPAELLAAIRARAASAFSERGLLRPDPVAVADPFPRELMSEEERAASADHWAVRPTVYAEAGADGGPDLEPGAPVALVTLGTSVDAADVEAAMVDALVAAGLRVLTTGRRGEDATADPRPEVRALGFTPLQQLLPLVDVVVSAGGSGTVLATLAAAKPLVIRPFLADQPWNAARLAAAGVAVAIDDPAEAGAAARRAVDDPSFREAATRVAAAIAATDDAAALLGRLTSLVPA